MLGRRRFNLLAGDVSGVYQQLRAGSRNGASWFIINRVKGSWGNSSQSAVLWLLAFSALVMTAA
jgi:hypothetical protein